jgi:hypothetical protein
MASVESLIKAFSAVTRGLNDDLETLKDLSSIHQHLPSSDDDENANPNFSTVLPNLRSLDAQLKVLEKKADEIQLIIEDEREASEAMIVDREKGEKMIAHLQTLALDTHFPANESDERRSSEVGRQSFPIQSSAGASAHHASTRQSLQPPSNYNGRQSLPPSASTNQQQQQPYVSSLSIITQIEFEALPKITRGRVTVSALNSAVSDINLTLPKHNSTTKLDEQLVVDEHTLRDSCGFFRSGESTAKGLIAVLKALKKVKQVSVEKDGGGWGVGYAILR